MTKWGRHLAGIVVGAVVIGACSSSGAPQARTQSTVARVFAATSTSAEPHTTTTAPSKPYTFDDSVPPPPLLNTGTDYVRILQSLFAYNNWIAARRPLDEYVPNANAPDSRAARSVLHDIALLRKAGARYFETVTAPDEIRVTSTRDDAVTFRVVQHLARQSIVDRNGKLVSDVARSATAYNVLMVKMDGGRWCLTDLDEVAMR